MTKFLGVWLAAALVLGSVCYAADVEVGGLIQAQYVVLQKTDKDVKDGKAPLTTFSTKAARVKVSSKLTGRISAQATFELAREPNTLEAMLDYTFSKRATVRVGQFVVPFGLETQMSNFDLEVTERSQVISHLWNNKNTNSPSAYIRDVGAMFTGRYKFLEMKLGTVNGVGYNYAENSEAASVFPKWGKDNDNHKDIVARFGAGIPMFAGLGFSIYDGKWPEKAVWAVKDAKGKDRYVVKAQNRKAMGLDLFLDTGKLLFQMEYVRGEGQMVADYVKETTPGDTLIAADTLKTAWSPDKYSGYYIVLGYRVTPLIEPVFKYDTYDPNRDKGDDILADMWVGLNLNFEGKARLQTIYRIRGEEPKSIDNNQVIVQVSGKF
jgi:hypothetical protein